MSKKIKVNLNGRRVGAFIGWPQPVGLILRRSLPEWQQLEEQKNSKKLSKGYKSYSVHNNSRHRGE